MRFYGIYLKQKTQVFKSYNGWTGCLPVDRGRSRSTIQSTDMHRMCTQPGWWAGRPGRSTARELLLSGKGPGQPTGRPAESSALCIQLRSTERSTGQRAIALWFLARSTRRSTGGTTVRNLTVGPVDRAVDRKGNSALSSCQRPDFFWAINTPYLS